jgi:excinuclease ABC subunit C
VQRIRDEAHRFAVTYHRRLRGKRQVESALDGLPGIGPARKKALIERFGSTSAVRRATVDDLRAVPGITESLARSILTALAEDM